MPLNINQGNLAYLQSKDPRLYEIVKSIIEGQQTIEQQVNGNASGNPLAPPNVNGVNVTAQNGHMTVSITDNNEIYRDIHYYAEHADNPHFSNPQIVHMGHSRNSVPIAIGNQTRYVRVYSSYASGPPSAPVVHGGITPVAVNGGGLDSGPVFLSSQGSGTGAAGAGLSGPGPIPFRTRTGAAPKR